MIIVKIVAGTLLLMTLECTFQFAMLKPFFYLTFTFYFIFFRGGEEHQFPFKSLTSTSINFFSNVWHYDRDKIIPL